MTDIYVGVGIMGLVAAGLFVLGLLAGRAGSLVAALLAVLAVGALGVHCLVFAEDPRLAWLLPFSSLVVVSNWTPLAVGFLAGLAWRRVPRPVWRKCLVTVPLVLAGLYYSYGRLLGSPPKGGNTWQDGVCMETYSTTSTACCAATLLKAHGIETSEREMVGLCLTRHWGTSKHGLYRGLKLKTAGTPYDVEVFSWSLDHLRSKPPGPVILLFRLTDDADKGIRYGPDRGWGLGLARTLVFFDFLGEDMAQIGDPTGGREKWPVVHITALWRGLGMRLVKREP